MESDKWNAYVRDMAELNALREEVRRLRKALERIAKPESPDDLFLSAIAINALKENE